MRTPILVAALLALQCLPASAGTGMRADLVVGGYDPATPGVARLAVRVRLDKGWKTYWRAPGENGNPSTFDWSGSANVAKATVSWPAPHRIRTPTFETVGYSEEVVFPVEILAGDPSRPVVASLHMELYGCETQCVMEQVELSARVPAGPGDPAALSRVSAWRAKVPSAGEGGITVLSAGRLPGRPGTLSVRVASRDGLSNPEVFVESAPASVAGASRRVGGDGREATFEVDVEGGPRSGPWTVTVVDGTASVEATVAEAPAPGGTGARAGQ